MERGGEGVKWSSTHVCTRDFVVVGSAIVRV